MNKLLSPKVKGGLVTALLAIAAVLFWRRFINPRVPSSFQV
jgi:hypothetical protein